MIDTKKQKKIYSEGAFYQFFGEKTKKDCKAQLFLVKTLTSR
jgi:hypothetical protein